MNEPLADNADVPGREDSLDQGIRAHGRRMYRALLNVSEYFVCLEDALGFKSSSQLHREVDAVLNGVRNYEPQAADDAPESMTGVEKREFRRSPAVGRIVCLANRGDDAEFGGDLLDVSMSGALLRVPQLLDVGADLDIVFVADDRKSSLLVSASVRRVLRLDDGHRIGCRFARTVPFRSLSGFLRQSLSSVGLESDEIPVEEINRALRRSLREQNKTID